MGVRLNLGADGPAVLTGGAFWVASRDGAGGAGSSLRFHTALDAGASPVVARSSSSSPSSRSLFFANGGRSKDVLVSTSAMTSSPKEYTTLPSALVVLSTRSLSDAPVGESAAAATTGKARRARRLEEDVMIRARDADDDRPRALARAAPATGGARRAPMAIDEVDMTSRLSARSWVPTRRLARVGERACGWRDIRDRAPNITILCRSPIATTIFGERPRGTPRGI